MKNCSLMTENFDTSEKWGKVSFGRIPKKQMDSRLENWNWGVGWESYFFTMSPVVVFYEAHLLPIQINDFKTCLSFFLLKKKQNA